MKFAVCLWHESLKLNGKKVIANETEIPEWVWAFVVSMNNLSFQWLCEKLNFDDLLIQDKSLFKIKFHYPKNAKNIHIFYKNGNFE